MNKERKLVLWITFQNKDLSQAFFKNNSKEEKMEEGLGLGKKKLCLQYQKQKLNLGFDRTAKLCCYNLGLPMTFYLNIF